jgi:hypothetical protein
MIELQCQRFMINWSHLSYKPASQTVLTARFEVLTAVTVKNVAFWDMKTQFVPHRRHITSPQ